MLFKSSLKIVCVFQLEEVHQDVVTSSQEMVSSNNQVIELRRKLQSMEIDLLAQCSMVCENREWYF